MNRRAAPWYEYLRARQLPQRILILWRAEKPLARRALLRTGPIKKDVQARMAADVFLQSHALVIYRKLTALPNRVGGGRANMFLSVTEAFCQISVTMRFAPLWN
jgi:hypothetical protein